ncbi:hydrogen gas-evolving membrane-bound hydrogenase subunit E [Clostridium sp. AM58-1XD]|uniref:hydrogen gas-evolving membrane-bound hydrogenase subunit E n=1 Tax=Clostridium sp. AM58-1XD TaxID=2292307 RepID=UPI000E4EB715|nr:hydrogen gas-evolving membrane-bound hydrogenase subunit E [Clostridium sp. AM58-1XD]RGZ00640.1 hypothetical protein DXA13_04195 [Clostridium sp. AM58-1XD]
MDSDKYRHFYRTFVNWVENGDPFDPEEFKEDGIYFEESKKRRTGKRLKHRAEGYVVLHGVPVFTRVYRIATRLICLACMCMLLLVVSHLPEFGRADNPSNNEVVERYLSKGLDETGATNIVTGVILDYRAFDTFGESVVLFLSVISVVTLLRTGEKKEDRAGKKEEPLCGGGGDMILKQVSVILIPFILLFGIYVILNGHLSPGGGFSGGTVIGAGLILYANAFGYERIHRFFSFRTFTYISSGALLIYGISKGYSFFCGGNHLESGIPLGRPGAIFSGGLILILNICVGLVVAGTVYCFYSLFREGEV